MAGRPKKRIDYAGWSVDIFSNDIKIDKLLDAQGWVGFGVYFYLCQMAFGSDGYYYEWGYDLCASTARKMGGGVSAGTVKEVVNYCLQIGLFDKRLFDRWGILTSKGIQKSYLVVLKSKNRKGTEIYRDYWLLDHLKEEEYRGVVFLRKDIQSVEEDFHSLGENEDSLRGNGYSLKQEDSKGKDRIVEERKEDCASRFSAPTIPADPQISVVFTAYMERIGNKSPLTEKIRDELMLFLQTMGPECCIRAMDEAVESGAINWKYVRKTLENKRDQGVRCISDWERVEKEWAGKRKGPKPDGYQPTSERIQKNSDWLDSFLAEQEAKEGGNQP